MTNPQNQATAFGGVEMTVRHIGGNEERVQVRQLPLRDMQAYVSATGDPVQKVALLTGNPDTWAQDLEPGSAFALMKKGDEINASFFDLLRYQTDRMAELMRGVRNGAGGE